MSSPERTASASVSPMLSPQRMVKSGLCIGCGTCMAESGDGAAMHLDRYGQLKPDRSNNPAGFAELCPFSPHARSEDQIALARFGSARFYDSRIGRFEAAYVGHVLEGSFRVDGSSGGMASWTAAELLRRKLVDAVAHVVPREGDGERLFRYQLSRTAEDLRKGAKSRYHPVELSGVVAEMKRHPGRYAVVGIPCFIKALHLLSLQDPALRERLAFTLGLFCGHMKSTRFVESFAWQMGTDMNAVAGVDYRLKDPPETGQLVHRPSAAQGWKHQKQGLVASGRRRLGSRVLPEFRMQFLRRRGCRNCRYFLRRRLGRTLFLRWTRNECRHRSLTAPAGARCRCGQRGKARASRGRQRLHRRDAGSRLPATPRGACLPACLAAFRRTA